MGGGAGAFGDGAKRAGGGAAKTERGVRALALPVFPFAPFAPFVSELAEDGAAEACDGVFAGNSITVDGGAAVATIAGDAAAACPSDDGSGSERRTTSTPSRMPTIHKSEPAAIHGMSAARFAFASAIGSGGGAAVSAIGKSGVPSASRSSRRATSFITDSLGALRGALDEIGATAAIFECERQLSSLDVRSD